MSFAMCVAGGGVLARGEAKVNGDRVLCELGEGGEAVFSCALGSSKLCAVN